MFGAKPKPKPKPCANTIVAEAFPVTHTLLRSSVRIVIPFKPMTVRELTGCNA